MEFIVAVDGPAGSGKGTITKMVGEKENLVYIDTGALYRCVTLSMLRKNIGLEDLEKIQEILNTIDIEFKKQDDQKLVYLNGENVSKEIREAAVNKFVSQVSHIVIVREAITDLSRKIAKGKEVIMEGRDIGTNVFPNADVKIYLDATPEERARRRQKQNEEKGINIPFEEIEEAEWDNDPEHENAEDEGFVDESGEETLQEYEDEYQEEAYDDYDEYEEYSDEDDWGDEILEDDWDEE